MSDEEKRWPFDGFYLKLVEAQREYEQEQHIDPASLTEEERQQKLQEINRLFRARRPLYLTAVITSERLSHLTALSSALDNYMTTHFVHR